MSFSSQAGMIKEAFEDQRAEASRKESVINSRPHRKSSPETVEKGSAKDHGLDQMGMGSLLHI
jgi:hypothetical protein